MADLDLTQFEGHTPGPWMKTGYGRVMASAALPVADVCGWALSMGLRPAQEGNAALIAAAPDLLAEVKRQAAEIERLRDALGRLYSAMQRRHYGRMPDEVQKAFDAARKALEMQK